MGIIELHVLVAAKAGNFKELARLLSEGPAASWSRSTRAEAVHWTAYHGHRECLGLLMAAGADLDAKTELGLTAAIYAAMGGHANCLSMLIDAGCRLDIQDDSGWSAADWARQRGKKDCLALIDAELERRDVAESIGLASAIQGLGPARL